MALVSVIAELERIGWEYQSASEDHLKCRCPFHADESPSCSINIRELLFNCKAANCGAKGDFMSFMAAALKTTRAVIYADFSKRYDLEDVKAIEPSVIEGYHADIWAQPHLLKELYLRGLQDADIRRYRLGHFKGRVTIPIRNIGGTFVNIRYYLPGGPSASKMLNARGRSKQMRLFPVDQTTQQKIVLCGGEIKAILVARLLNPHGYGAVCNSGGEGNWHHSITPYFKDKDVWILYDIDEAGVKGAQTVAAILSQVTRSLRICSLPLDPEKYPKGDVNDFVASENGDVLSVVTSAVAWTSPISALATNDDDAPIESKFSDTVTPQMVGKRMRFPAVVSAALPSPFIVPKQIVPTCDKSQEVCAACAIFPKDQKLFVISPESPAILAMVGVKEQQLDLAIRSALGIPKRCSAVTFEITGHHNAEDIRINPSLDISNRDNDRSMQQAVVVGCDAELNATYEFTGRMYPHPQTQQATLVLSGSKATHDSLSRYEPKRLPDLRVFRPVEWTVESLSERLSDIYTDLSSNVTRIFERQDIHLFIDLAYHSALLIDVDGKTTKGWTELLIVGDSSQGKSEVFSTMLKHYQLGEKIECKNATVAGLLGGLRQIGTAWYVAWGVIPTHDRRLVGLEELKGASRETIARLTDMRSSGIAELPKIEKKRTHARTRIIALSNPRDDRTMSSFAFGVEAIRDLIGAPEDVRRFDAALIVSASDVDSRRVNDLVRDPPKVRHRYTSELCRELILWAWTRSVKQVVIPDESATLISAEASRMSEEYSSVIPLVDGGSMRHKLSRLAVSLAARTFSTGETELDLLVRPCHVTYICNLLHRVYNHRNFGYNYFSEAARATDKMIDKDSVKSYMECFDRPSEVQEHLLYADAFDLTDIQDWCNWDRDEAQRFLSLLVRKRAIRREPKGRKYHKTSDFIQWLKSTTLDKRPKHLDDSAKETI